MTGNSYLTVAAFSPLITRRFAYRDYEQGFEAMRSGDCGKVILDWRNVG